MEENSKLLWIFAIVAAVILTVGYFYYVKYYKKAEAPIVPEGSTVESLIEKVTPINPLEKLPDTNPIEKTNPFKNLNTNPFK